MFGKSGGSSKSGGWVPRGPALSGHSPSVPGEEGGGQPQGAQQPSGGSVEPRNAVSQVVSGAGNTVQHDPELQGMALRWLERQLPGN